MFTYRLVYINGSLVLCLIKQALIVIAFTPMQFIPAENKSQEKHVTLGQNTVVSSGNFNRHRGKKKKI